MGRPDDDGGRAAATTALRRALQASRGAPVSARDVIGHLTVDRRGRPTPLMVELLLESAAHDPASPVRSHRSLGDPEPRYSTDADASVGRGPDRPTAGG